MYYPLGIKTTENTCIFVGLNNLENEKNTQKQIK